MTMDELNRKAWEIIQSSDLIDVLTSGARGTTTPAKKALADHYLKRIGELRKELAAQQKSQEAA